MGNKRCDRLSDSYRMGAAVYLRCPGCNHRGVMDAERACRLFLRNNWNDALEVAGQRFRCSICSRRGVEVLAGSVSEHGRREWTRGSRR